MKLERCEPRGTCEHCAERARWLLEDVPLCPACLLDALDLLPALDVRTAS